jgi:competence protein ComEA
LPGLVINAGVNGMKLVKNIVSHLVLVFSLLIIGQPVFAQTVNINTASAEELSEHMTGVGETRAQAIVAYREQHGAFTQVEDLLAVDGIGERTLERNRDRLIVE